VIAEPPVPVRTLVVTFADNPIGEVAALIATQHQELRRPLITIIWATTGIYGALPGFLTETIRAAADAAGKHQPMNGTVLVVPEGMQPLIEQADPRDDFKRIDQIVYPQQPSRARQVSVLPYPEEVTALDPKVLMRDAAIAVARGWVRFSPEMAKLLSRAPFSSLAHQVYAPDADHPLPAALAYLVECSRDPQR
jgi:hypothetical protein